MFFRGYFGSIVSAHIQLRYFGLQSRRKFLSEGERGNYCVFRVWSNDFSLVGVGEEEEVESESVVGEISFRTLSCMKIVEESLAFLELPQNFFIIYAKALLLFFENFSRSIHRRMKALERRQSGN